MFFLSAEKESARASHVRSCHCSRPGRSRWPGAGGACLWQAGWPTYQTSLQLCFPGTQTSWGAGQGEWGRGGELGGATPGGLPPSPSQLGVPTQEPVLKYPGGHPAHSSAPPHLSTSVPCPDLGGREEAQDPLESSEEGERWHRASRFSNTKGPQVQLPSSNCREAPTLIPQDIGHPCSLLLPDSSRGQTNHRADSLSGKRPK